MSGLVMQENKLKRLLMNHKGVPMLLLLLGVFIYLYIWHIPLPRDEELIETFRAHRTDIEEL